MLRQFRGLLIAAALLAVLGGLVWWSNRAEKAKQGQPAKDASPKLTAIPENQIQQIEIARRGGEVTVVRKNDKGKWELTAPKALGADQDALSNISSTLASFNTDRLVEEKVESLAPFGLDSPALVVTVTKKDGKTEKLLFGDETPTGGGVFAKLEGDPRIFSVATWNKSTFDKTYRDLRDKRLLTFDSDKLSRVELTAKNQTIEFGKNNQNEWQILKPRPLRADTFQVEEIVRKLRDAKMDTSGTEDDPKKALASFSGAKPVAVARVTDNAGTQQIEVRKDKDNNYWAKSSVLEGAFKVGSELGEGLDKGLDDVRNKKLCDFGFSEPGKVEITAGGKTTVYEKSGEKWTSGGKTMDSASVQNLIDKLRDLTSAKFSDASFGAPALEASVTWNDGKRTDKVALAKSGKVYLARRENEPAVYEVESSAVESIEKAASEVKEAQPEGKKDEKKKK